LVTNLLDRPVWVKSWTRNCEYARYPCCQDDEKKIRQEEPLIFTTSSFSPAPCAFLSLRCIAATVERTSVRPRANPARATNMAIILFVLLVFASFSHSHSLSAVTTLPIVSKTVLPNIAYSTFISVITSTTIQEQVNIYSFGQFAVTRTSELDQIVYETSTIVTTIQERGFTTSTATIGSSTVFEKTEASSAAKHTPTASTRATSHSSAKSGSSSPTFSTTRAATATATNSPQSTQKGLSSKSKAAIAISAIVVPVFLVGLAFWIALVWRRRKEAAARRAQYDTEGRTTDDGAVHSAAVVIAGEEKEEPTIAERTTNTPDSQRRLWDEKDSDSVISAFYPHPGVRPLETLASTTAPAAPAPAALGHEASDSGTVRSNSRSTQATGGITALPRIPRDMPALPQWHWKG